MIEHSMPFHQRRRQPFLHDRQYHNSVELFKKCQAEALHAFNHPENEDDRTVGLSAFHWDMVATFSYRILQLHYTAGEAIEPLRNELGAVIFAYEQSAPFHREKHGDTDQPVLYLAENEDYFLILQLIGLCYLLHRRDLLPHLASLVNGPDETYAGWDCIYEDFLAYGVEGRYECDTIQRTKPYKPFSDAMCDDSPSEALVNLDIYVKNWYKGFRKLSWHDTHTHDPAANYVGYWAFEAAALAYLLNLDDSSFHQYPYYPKDMVTFARSYATP